MSFPLRMQHRSMPPLAAGVLAVLALVGSARADIAGDPFGPPPPPVFGPPDANTPDLRARVEKNKKNTAQQVAAREALWEAINARHGGLDVATITVPIDMLEKGLPSEGPAAAGAVWRAMGLESIAGVHRLWETIGRGPLGTRSVNGRVTPVYTTTIAFPVAQKQAVAAAWNPAWELEGLESRFERHNYLGRNASVVGARVRIQTPFGFKVFGLALPALDAFDPTRELTPRPVFDDPQAFVQAAAALPFPENCRLRQDALEAARMLGLKDARVGFVEPPRLPRPGDKPATRPTPPKPEPRRGTHFGRFFRRVGHVFRR